MLVKYVRMLTPRACDFYKDWWTTTCGEILPLQPEPENAEDKNAVAVLKESRVIGHIPYHLANTKDRTRIITYFISKPTNRGSVEFSGKAVSRGGGLGMEIPCVYNFDGPKQTRQSTSTINRRRQQPSSTYGS